MWKRDIRSTTFWHKKPSDGRLSKTAPPPMVMSVTWLAPFGRKPHPRLSPRVKSNAVIVSSPTRTDSSTSHESVRANVAGRCSIYEEIRFSSARCATPTTNDPITHTRDSRPTNQPRPPRRKGGVVPQPRVLQAAHATRTRCWVVAQAPHTLTTQTTNPANHIG